MAGDITIIINDPPYGTEKAWNALRLAQTLRIMETTIQIFLLGDAVSIAKKGQEVPRGYYNLQEMITGLTTKGVKIIACVTCLKARGLQSEDIIPGVSAGGMKDLAQWVADSDKVLTF